MVRAKAQAEACYTKIAGCRMCGDKNLELVLSLGEQYVIGFVKERDDGLPKAPLELVRCHGCGLLQLLHSTQPSLMWGDTYGYKSSVNETMREALSDLVADAHHQADTCCDTKATWLDIGANDGFLISQVPSTYRKIACEPVTQFHALLEEHADQVVPGFFSADAVNEPCDVITSAAMFYDLDDPNSFVEGIAQVLNKGGVWVNQLTSTRAMMQKTDLANIVHEHRFFPDESNLRRLYDRHGLAITSISYNDVNGGSMRITAQNKADAKRTAPEVPALTNVEVADFVERTRRWKELMGWIVDAMAMAGRSIWGYAASTKGATLLQFLDKSEFIVGIADRNHQKEGLMMPGVWVPITSEATMRQARPDVLFGLAWGFKTGMLEREAELRRSGTAFLWPMPEISFTL